MLGPTGKKLYPFIILIAVAIGVFWGIHSRRNASTSSTTPLTTNGESTFAPIASPATNRAAVAMAVSNGSSPTTAEPSVQSVPSAPLKGPEAPYLIGSADAAPQMEPMTLLGNVRHVINDYGSMFGGNPVGTNPEITADLNGDNPKGVKFLKEDLGMRVNGRGELVDSWGTPFFFHQLSGTQTEIRSAGPDRKMYTADDLVTK